MPDQPRLLAFESVGADQLISVAFDAIQPCDVSECNVGDFGLHGAGIIELPPRMRPTEHLLNAAGGVDTVVTGERIGVEISLKAFQEFHRSVALSARRVVVNREGISPVAAVDPESRRAGFRQTGIEHGDRRIVGVDRLR